MLFRSQIRLFGVCIQSENGYCPRPALERMHVRICVCVCPEAKIFFSPFLSSSVSLSSSGNSNRRTLATFDDVIRSDMTPDISRLYVYVCVYKCGICVFISLSVCVCV